MRNRIVICGAGGQVGRFLTAEAQRAGREVLALSSTEWDVSVPRAGEGLVEPRDVVVNCAAYTAVDAAETDQDAAEAVNVAGPGNVARTCARAGARLIHLSTDYVFSGQFDGVPRPYDVSDAPAPLSVYGRTKLAGELAVHTELPGAHVVRTAWVYTGDGGDFVASMMGKADDAETVEVVADQVGSPTYVADLVSALLELVDGRITAPLLHAANAGAASRYEQAKAVFEAIGADPDRVLPVPSDRQPRLAPRPAYSVLSARESAQAGLTPLRPWRDALAEAVSNALSAGR